MSKILVAYFSAGGCTAAAARMLAEAARADLFEIRPETPYTAADLDWRDKQSRSTVEMQNTACRPALVAADPGIDSYDTVFLGFPIWWGREPSVVDTFIEAYGLARRRVVPFCTSGGGGFTHKKQLQALLPGAEAHKELTHSAPADAAQWLQDLGL